MPSDEETELRISSDRWVCCLEIYRDSADSAPLYGTGFLVNFRDVAKKLIIVTAGHNIFDGGKRVHSIRISFSELLVPKIDPIVATEDRQLFVSEEYKSNSSKEADDYGLIVLDGEKVGGFAFSAIIPDSVLKDRATEANIVGYRAEGEKGLAKVSGRFEQVSERQISYRINAQPGLSGGPIWTDYAGCDTAIGIHNYGREPSQAGNTEGKKKLTGARCTRLTKDVLLVMATWIEGFPLNIPIYATIQSEKRYLKVSSPSSQGSEKACEPRPVVCCLLPGQDVPKFDIIPVQAPLCKKEAKKGQDDYDWGKYIYVVRITGTESFLGHTKVNANTPSDRSHLLRCYDWTKEILDAAAGPVGWILFRNKSRGGFYLLRTPDMRMTAMKPASLNEKEVQVLAFSHTTMPPIFACDRRREIGGEEGITFKELKEKDKTPAFSLA
ncbi:uncharacterized protein BDR25DRAFT_381159 [Lindgomyces ingoldianus]|uniref:Uncharacterized protein n=1 Tax=Lindgomyces ingoldianus TaxID=673940 RepID=A0ACB6QCP3_9PLEO|nr:uncharacterized protein BDR25DRAFT_381159 [Lindgomyces ingoldianus]KAF2464378.1 hypothetical protein BDR25DRAFT_381159 [Lindgomyces ingoldianus]